MAKGEDTPEDRCVETLERWNARYEADAISEHAAMRLGGEDALVLPHPLGEQGGALQEAAAGLDLYEGNVVIVDGKEAS